MTFFITQLELESKIGLRLPNDIDLNELKDYIKLFKYPCGCLPFNLYFNNSKAYLSTSIDEDYAYFNDFFYFLHDYYTEEEYDIIVSHAALSFADQFVLDPPWRDKARQLIQYQTEKPEIQFLLDDIRYLHTRSLLYNENTKESKEIAEHVAYLKTIETEHNNFKIDIIGK